MPSLPEIREERGAATRAPCRRWLARPTSNEEGDERKILFVLCDNRSDAHEVASEVRRSSRDVVRAEADRFWRRDLRDVRASATSVALPIAPDKVCPRDPTMTARRIRIMLGLVDHASSRHQLVLRRRRPRLRP